MGGAGVGGMGIQGFEGLGVWGLGFEVEDLGFGSEGVGVRVVDDG